MSDVCVIGLGYIGLPTAAMLASRGHQVTGYDISESVVATVSEGLAHFREPDLDMLLSAAVQTGRLKAQRTPVQADFHIIAVPTPFKEGHSPDVSHIVDAVRALAPMLRPGDTVILESTSPVGTTESIGRQISDLRPELHVARLGEAAPTNSVYVAHCPERILPGNMLRELVENDRIIGGLTKECVARAKGLYGTFVAGLMYETDARTAEFVKLAENAFRDVNIAFANELSLICDQLKLDVWRVIALANRHPRVNILQPGAGVGGHCIAVDPWFIVHSAPGQANLITAARNVNDQKPHYIASIIRQYAARFRAPVVVCYGLTYKPNVDDLRESPAVVIAHELARDGDVQLLVCDPWVAALPPALAKLANVSLVDEATARQRADIVAILVAHEQFSKFDQMYFSNTIVVDAAGVLANTPQHTETTDER